MLLHFLEVTYTALFIWHAFWSKNNYNWILYLTSFSLCFLISICGFEYKTQNHWVHHRCGFLFARIKLKMIFWKDGSWTRALDHSFWAQRKRPCAPGMARSVGVGYFQLAGGTSFSAACGIQAMSFSLPDVFPSSLFQVWFRTSSLTTAWELALNAASRGPTKTNGIRILGGLVCTLKFEKRLSTSFAEKTQSLPGPLLQETELNSGRHRAGSPKSICSRHQPTFPLASSIYKNEQYIITYCNS